MKETDFIQQNQKKWGKLEAQLKGKVKDDANLGERFVQLSEDLSYAQTYYKRRTVRVYLNTLAQRMYKRVFNARTKDKKKLGRFWSHELPTALWEGRLELTITLIVFLIAAFIGVVSSQYEDGFAAQILGNHYVNMTESNIEKGDPMGVYKDMDAVPMFFMIMYNNLQVSAFTFILGILFGVGTLGIVFKNGVMVGVFQFFFFQRGVGFESFLTIWQHGTIEIASIIVAGGAGLVLGKSIMFPGTLPRSVSLKFGFLKGLKILLGVAPLIVLAAFIESFYTRFDDLPMVFRLLTIGASLAFIIGYYIILPIKRGRKISLLRDVAENYSESHIEYNLNLHKLKSNGEILSDSLIIIQQNLGAFMRAAIGPALLLALAIVVFLRSAFQEYFYFTPLSGFLPEQISQTIREVFVRFEMIGLLLRFQEPMMMLVVALLLSWVTFLSIRLFSSLLPIAKTSKISIKLLIALFLVHLIFLAPFAISLWYAWFYFIIALPLIGVAFYIHQQEKLSLSKSVATAFSTMISFLLKHLGMIIITGLFSFLVTILVQSPVLYLMFELGNDFVGFTENNAKYLVEVIIVFITLLSFFCSISFLTLNSIMNYRSMLEIKEAPQLKKDIESISVRQSLYGTSSVR